MEKYMALLIALVILLLFLDGQLNSAREAELKMVCLRSGHSLQECAAK